jgi:hypothetical protein
MSVSLGLISVGLLDYMNNKILGITLFSDRNMSLSIRHEYEISGSHGGEYEDGSCTI